jgi:hypothetical protein
MADLLPRRESSSQGICNGDASWMVLLSAEKKSSTTLARYLFDEVYKLEQVEERSPASE